MTTGGARGGGGGGALAAGHGGSVQDERSRGSAAAAAVSPACPPIPPPRCPTPAHLQERLMHALAVDRVPDSWMVVGYPTLRSLGSWMHNLLQRVAQIQEWTADLNVPKSVWLSGWVPQLVGCGTGGLAGVVALCDTAAPAGSWSSSFGGQPLLLFSRSPATQPLQPAVLPDRHQADHRAPQRVGARPHRAHHRGVGLGGAGSNGCGVGAPHRASPKPVRSIRWLLS